MDINKLMKQAAEMKEKVQAMQEQADNAEVTGEAGAGLVKVVMNGRHDVRSVSLDDALMEESKEFLEDLLTAAINDAVHKVEAQSRDAISSIAGGNKPPPGFKFSL